ncbi:hypothetical protein GCM10012280_55760 [Wenjunlia tyrosinilytica]|uniref:Uncharacterized protein n=1 Tax=Wenjunlia tyrosinilytica TaxID=1544741 RepID=A0A917ZVM7_9ACTN|nr:hypothetical protein GCM10012280_55760 [Wenjunlia tyrosinilytica]
MRKHRMDLRVYSVDGHGKVTREGPRQEVEVYEVPMVLSCLAPWPRCQCPHATGRPCPLDGEGPHDLRGSEGLPPAGREQADRGEGAAIDTIGSERPGSTTPGENESG